MNYYRIGFKSKAASGFGYILFRPVFSLIELLVVLAIIAILMTILLPALKKARDKTLEINCTSNEKQIFLGLNFYADAKDDYYPCHSYNLYISTGATTNKTTRWFAMIAPLMGIPSGSSTQPNVQTALVCPATVQKIAYVDLAFGRIGAGSNDCYFTSYVASGHITGQKRTRIKNKVYMAYDGYYADAWGTQTSPHVTFRHSNAVMMLWTDGSANKVKYSDFGKSPSWVSF